MFHTWPRGISGWSPSRPASKPIDSAPPRANGPVMWPQTPARLKL